MSNYSIVRVGNEYIVQAGDNSILRISSRRRAVKIMTLAADLLDQESMQQVEDAPSISRDLPTIPEKSELP
ncbi:N-glycosylase/DNA lyase [Bradyrhizobium sp. USDA 4011]